MAEASAILPEIDIPTFFLSLGSSVLIALGELDEQGEPIKGGPTPPPDLALAKQTIDLISLLHGKMKGNLAATEDKLVVSVLADLRLKYVEAQKRV